MSCLNKKTPERHRWSTVSTTRLLAHNGTREVWQCNDCLAIKVTFTTDDSRDATASRTSTFVVEPAEQV